MPADILSPQHPRFSQITLSIENLPLRNFDGEHLNAYMRAIPTNQLVSLKLGTPTPPLATRLGSLKRLVLDARRLETFHYQDRGQGTQFAFSESERLPAFRDLTLKSYDWNHDREAVKAHWDFSRIRSLELVMVPVFNFLASVSFPDFSELHHLHVEDFSAHLIDRRKDATFGLYILVKNHIRALQSLQITCHTLHFPIDALLTHAPTLETLRFRDHVGFAEDDRHCPTMWTDDLALLSRHLVHLKTLELDMDITNTEPPRFLGAIAAFPSLHTLTLHVQTVLHAEEVIHPGTDRDLATAVYYFNTLLRHKVGVPWRSITINVGGWRQVMLRRLGEAWRRQNLRGVFAERCFVLERPGPWTGYHVREEKCIESGLPDDEDMFAERFLGLGANPVPFW
jgi:hypothetical protein